MKDMEDAEIERELRAAQADVLSAPQRRRAAVTLAREHNWSKYQIAAVLGVKVPTVTAILATVQRKANEEEGASD